MTGQASWLTLVIMLGGLAAIALLAWGSYAIASRFNWRVQRVTCPKLHESTEVLVKIDPTTGRRVDVERCALLDDPDHVDCYKGCLAELQERSG